jgi:hypothetical protein
MLKENVRRKLWDEGERTRMHLAARCRKWDQKH